MSHLADHVVRDDAGVPLKEWYAIASYLDAMGEEMDPQYAETDGRKVVYSSWNPVRLLRNANKFTLVVLAVIVLLVAVIVLVTRAIVRRVRRKRK